MGKTGSSEKVQQGEKGGPQILSQEHVMAIRYNASTRKQRHRKTRRVGTQLQMEQTYPTRSTQAQQTSNKR